MSALRFLIKLSIVSSLFAAPLLAQDDGPTPVPVVESAPVHVSDNPPVPVAEGSPGNIAFGYSYLNMNLGGEPTANLHGINASATIDFLPRWGVALDSSYLRAGRDPGSGHGSYVLSVLAGPVFIPVQNRNTRLLVRALAGVSLVDSSVRVNDLYYRGWLSRFSWAVGTGLERNLPPIKARLPFAVRFNIDYLRTRFVSSDAVARPQNGIRFGASIVYRFGPRETDSQRLARQP